MTETVTCGLFQIYFQDNFFSPGEKIKIPNNEKLTKKGRETLQNKLFLLDKDKNEQLMEEYAGNTGQ